MRRIDRQEQIRRCIDIVNRYKPSSLKAFVFNYKMNYGGSMSETTARRLFPLANIIFDHNNKIYVHIPPSNAFLDITDSEFDESLKLHSKGEYNHEHGTRTIWLAVDLNKEKELAQKIYTYCEGGVTIIIGFACLSVRCHNLETQRKLEKRLFRYRDWKYPTYYNPKYNLYEDVKKTEEE